MAKTKLSRLLPSLESEDGVARPVDVKETGASLDKPELKTSEDDGSKKGQVEEAHQDVAAGMKDFTAVDEASKRQGEAIAKQLDRLQEATASTEAYLDLLKSNRRQGLDSGTASVIAHDLKQIYPKFFSKAVASLEAIDDDASDQKRIGNTNDAEKETTGRLAKLKAAGKEAWKKFWEWVKKRWDDLKNFFAKVKKLFAKEKEKTTFLLGCAKSGNPSSAKTDTAGAEGTKTAAAIKALGHEKKPAKENKPEPKPEPMPEKVSVPSSGYLHSVENDWLGIGRYESTQLRSISQSWAPVVIRALKKLVTLTNTASKSDPDFEYAVETILKEGMMPVLATSVGASNKILEAQEDGGWKLVAGPSGGDTSTDYKVIPRSECVDTLSRIIELYNNADEFDRVYENIKKVADELDTNLVGMAFFGGVPNEFDAQAYNRAKAAIKKYVSSVVNSDFVALNEHCARAAKARRDVVDAMIAEYVKRRQ